VILVETVCTSFAVDADLFQFSVAVLRTDVGSVTVFAIPFQFSVAVLGAYILAFAVLAISFPSLSVTVDATDSITATIGTEIRIFPTGATLPRLGLLLGLADSLSDDRRVFHRFGSTRLFPLLHWRESELKFPSAREFLKTHFRPNAVSV